MLKPFQRLSLLGTCRNAYRPYLLLPRSSLGLAMMSPTRGLGPMPAPLAASLTAERRAP
jgi:hypothetical protein